MALLHLPDNNISYSIMSDEWIRITTGIISSPTIDNSIRIPDYNIITPSFKLSNNIDKWYGISMYASPINNIYMPPKVSFGISRYASQHALSLSLSHINNNTALDLTFHPTGQVVSINVSNDIYINYLINTMQNKVRIINAVTSSILIEYTYTSYIIIDNTIPINSVPYYIINIEHAYNTIQEYRFTCNPNTTRYAFNSIELSDAVKDNIYTSQVTSIDYTQIENTIQHTYTILNDTHEKVILYNNMLNDNITYVKNVYEYVNDSYTYLNDNILGNMHILLNDSYEGFTYLTNINDMHQYISTINIQNMVDVIDNKLEISDNQLTTGCVSTAPILQEYIDIMDIYSDILSSQLVDITTAYNDVYTHVNNTISNIPDYEFTYNHNVNDLINIKNIYNLWKTNIDTLGLESIADNVNVINNQLSTYACQLYNEYISHNNLINIINDINVITVDDMYMPYNINTHDIDVKNNQVNTLIHDVNEYITYWDDIQKIHNPLTYNNDIQIIDMLTQTVNVNSLSLIINEVNTIANNITDINTLTILSLENTIENTENYVASLYNTIMFTNKDYTNDFEDMLTLQYRSGSLITTSANLQKNIDILIESIIKLL